MGFSVMSFGDNCDLGIGPEFSLCEVNNRPMSKKRLRQFVLAVGGDPSNPDVPPANLHRYDPQHAIVIVISSKYLHRVSLVQNPTSRQEFPHIRFKGEGDFENASAMVINGHGRIVFVREHLCRDAVSEYTKIVKAIKSSGTSHKRLTAKQMETHIARRIELIDILRESSSWLVAVYDLGAYSFPCLFRSLSSLLQNRQNRTLEILCANQNESCAEHTHISSS